MIVSTSLIRRREDITIEQFQRHWLDPHGPLTARLPGVLRYDQNHVIADAPGTNAAGRAMHIDGFPILAFKNTESRRAAHHSPEMAACNADSRHFIGAVARIISNDGGIAPPADAQNLVKQIVLVPRDIAQVDLAAILPELEGVHASILHTVLEQGAAPNSTIQFIGVEVQSLAELWVRDQKTVELNAARFEDWGPGIATFQAEVYSWTLRSTC